MKKKEIGELYNQALPELKKQVIVLVNEIKKVHIDLSTGKLKNTNLLGSKKKDIARLKTIIKIKEHIKE